MPARTRTFSFLAKGHPHLAKLLAQAESYVGSDPNTAIIKLRQFAEALAAAIANDKGIEVADEEDLHALLQRLWDAGVLPGVAASGLHALRREGNRAVHQHAGTRGDAQALLQAAHELALWFHVVVCGNTPPATRADIGRLSAGAATSGANKTIGTRGGRARESVAKASRSDVAKKTVTKNATKKKVVTTKTATKKTTAKNVAKKTAVKKTAAKKTTAKKVAKKTAAKKTAAKKTVAKTAKATSRQVGRAVKSPRQGEPGADRSAGRGGWIQAFSRWLNGG